MPPGDHGRFPHAVVTLMNEDSPQLQRDHELVKEARAAGGAKKWLIYTRLSGPGWLQSAITLGGGSLAGSLYLGVLGGFSLLWLQPVAMIAGIVMLSAISFVVLSTGERPFQAINKHVNPVLGWAWALATLMANVVWALPQYGLATGAMQQNLLPNLLGPDSAMGDMSGKLIIVGVILVVTISITWLYDSGGWGVKIYELVLKLMVATIVISFFGVVFRMAFSGDGLPWGEIFSGFIPNPGAFSHPAASIQTEIDAVAPAFQDFWTEMIVKDQRDVMITAVATAVGVNMTFLLGYSMLSRGWNRDFRGLAIFDLSTGMFIPFLLATSCVVIASALQFHGEPEPGLLGEVNEAGVLIEPAPNVVGPYNGLLAQRLTEEIGPDAVAALDEEALAARADELPDADKRMAAMLVKRDAFNLARSLEPFTGSVFANVIFGIGVVGMGVSTITILMLISGFVICEMLGLPPKGWPHRLGCLAACAGALGPFFWSKAAVWLAVPTSVFGMALLPIAYISFFFLMNQKKLLGADMPSGGKRVAWNALLGASIIFATTGAMYSIWSKLAWKGIAIVAVVAIAAVVAHFLRADDTQETA